MLVLKMKNVWVYDKNSSTTYVYLHYIHTPVLVNSGQAWVSKMSVDGAEPHTYGTTIRLTDHYSGNTTQCTYIGLSMEQIWSTEVVMRSELRKAVCIQLIVGSCKGYAWRTLNSTRSFSNNTDYQAIL